jgi:two-component system, OmpR family, KDP operon response regulator KdpE
VKIDDRPAAVLVADDDGEVRRAVTLSLGEAGARVFEAVNGREGLFLFHSRHPDVVLTDLEMPGGDGFHLIRGIRQVSSVPVVVLSVHGREESKVAALDLGADDYVTKPFSGMELHARVRAALRRSRLPATPEAGLLRFPDLEVDLIRRHLTQGGRRIRLTRLEFRILEVLSTSFGRPYSVSALITAVWMDAPGTTADTVRVHVCTLRRKLEPDPSRPRYIVTEPFVGYRFLPDPLLAE